MHEVVDDVDVFRLIIDVIVENYRPGTSAVGFDDTRYGKLEI